MAMTLVDCGCVARVYPDDSGIELVYCSMHEAAPELLKACEMLVESTGWEAGVSARKARAAIRKAKGEPCDE